MQYIPLCVLELLALLVCNSVRHSTFFLRIWLPPHSPFLAHYRPYNDEGANILTGDGKWPGSTPDDHVVFKSTTQLSHPTFSEGLHYIILNATGRALSLYQRRGLVRDLYLFNLPAYPQPVPRETLFVCIISGYLVNYSISVRCIVFPQDPKWWWHCVALRAFRKMGRAEFLCSSDRIQLLLQPNWEQRLVLVSSTTLCNCSAVYTRHSICPDKTSRQVFYDPQDRYLRNFQLVSD